MENNIQQFIKTTIQRLLSEKMTYNNIGKELGVSERSVYRYINQFKLRN